MIWSYVFLLDFLIPFLMICSVRNSIPVKKPTITVIFLYRSVITQGRFAGGLGQEFTEYILLGPASTSIHFISIKMSTEAEFMNIQFH